MDSLSTTRNPGRNMDELPVIAPRFLQCSFQTLRRIKYGTWARTRADPGIVLVPLEPTGFGF